MHIKRDNPTFLFRDAPYQIMLSIGNHQSTPTRIMKSTGCTYSYIIQMLNDMEGWGWIQMTKIGREQRVKFTERGVNVYACMMALVEAMR